MTRWVLILMLAIPSLVWATDFYASPNGTGNCSSGSPCSLATGLNQLGAGHTLILFGGTYGGGGSLWEPPNVKGTSFNNPVRMQAFTGQTVVIAGGFSFELVTGNAFWIIENIAFDNQDSTELAVLSGNFVRYINVEFRNARHSGLQGCGGGGCEFYNCRAYGNGQGPNGLCWVGADHQCHGLYLNTGSGHLVDGGEFHHNQGSGLHFYNAVTGSTVRNAKLHSNSGMGVQIVQGGGTHTFENNVIYNNGLFGVEITSIGTAEVYNNTSYNNAQFGFLLRSSGNITARNNISMASGADISDNGQTNGSFTSSNNLCDSPGFGCQAVANVAGFFASPSMGDFRLSADDNGGINIAGSTPTTDKEGFARGNPPDRGAYEFGGVSEPPQPVGKNGEWLLNAGSGSSAVDTSGFGQTCLLNSPGWTVPGIVGPADLATNGLRWCQAAPAPEMRAITSQFGISGWWNGTGAGMTPDGCELFSDGDSKVARIAMNGNLVCFFYDGTNWNFATATGTNMLVGGAHHWSCSYESGVAGADGLRARLDNASVAHAPFSAPVSYTLGGSVFIGRHGNGGGNICGTGTIGDVTIFDQFITNEGNTNLYNARAPIAGTSSTDWQFFQADVAENTQIAGSGVDAANIVMARSGKVRQRWNVKRFGSTIIEHFFTECSLNGGTFTTIDNSCASRPVCIAPDSVKNMGDSTANLLPNDGFNFVAGRFVVDTLNTGIQTIVADGQATEWETGYAFNQSLSDNDVVRCRLRTGAGDFGPSGYPAVLPTMTISVPAGGLSGGASMSGGQSRGGGRR